MINENYLKLQNELQNQLTNDSDTLELSAEQLRLIMEIDDPEFIQDLFQEKQKLSVQGRHNVKVEIPLDWNIDEKILGVCLFQKMDSTSFHGIIFLGWGKWDKGRIYPTFFIFNNKVVSYWEDITDKQSCITKGCRFFDYTAISIIRRLQQHAQNQEQKKLDTILMRLSELPEETLKSIITYKNLKLILLKANTDIINSFLSCLIKIQDRFEQQYYQDLFLNLLRFSVENNNLLVVKALLILENSPILTAKDKCLPKILKFLDHFKGRIAKDIILEFFTSLFFDEDIVLEKLEDVIFSENNRPIFYSAKLFYIALNKERTINRLPPLAESIETDFSTAFALLKNTVLSILNFTSDIDISFLIDFIVLFAQVCRDQNHEDHLEQINQLSGALRELFAINFDQFQNKTLFSNNKNKADFYRKKLSFFANSQEQMIGDNQAANNHPASDIFKAAVLAKIQEI